MSEPSSSSYRTRAGAGAGAGAGGSSSSDPAGAAQEMEVMETATTSSDDTMMMMMREHMFDKVVTPSDVGKLNRLVIPKQHAERYFPLDSSSNEKGLILNFEDRGGKCWRFRYSYWNSSQSYVMTKGWSRFVKEKKLDAGDIVSFQRGVGERGKGRFYIDWRRRKQDHHHPQHNIHHRFPDHHLNHHQYYMNPPLNNNMLLNQSQHGSWSCTAGVATTTPPLFAYALRPQPSSSAYHLPPALPLRCFTRDHNQSHLSQIMMMTTTTTTTATTSGSSNIGPNSSQSDDQYRYLHNITHPNSNNNNNITSNTLISNYYQHGQTHQYHHPQSNISNQQYLIHHGTSFGVGVGGGTQTQTTTDHQMQTARYINNIIQGTTNTSSSRAVVFDSVPVVQYGKTPKRLRLFGVNMDCPISSTSRDDNDEDDNDDDDEDEVDDIDIDNQDDRIQDSYCNNNVSNYGSMAPPPLNYQQQQQKHHYHEQISSTPLQLRLYNGAYASPLPITNASTSTSAVTLSSADVDSITDKGKSSMSLDFDI